MNDFIEQYSNVITQENCQKIISIFDANPSRRQGETGGGIDISKKLSEDLVIDQLPLFKQPMGLLRKAVTYSVREYIKKYFFILISGISFTIPHPKSGQPVQLTEANFEELGLDNIDEYMQLLFQLAPMNVQKYAKEKGNYGYWHSEIYPELPNNKALHRVLLILVYLNDVDVGGETDFYYQNKSIKPKAGSIVIAPCGFTHTHRGNIPISSDKYVIASWVSFNPANQIYT
jgi:hypothetical protein